MNGKKKKYIYISLYIYIYIYVCVLLAGITKCSFQDRKKPERDAT